ncbi:hypothetical protein [Croceibacterium aestuarii]|uniref:hypothetical protein n=1 Tax=Croceibacterium aestuarii TaxID=3064139 RepID=UPI00272DD62E|nr:hypothetical protein [Croceibacterium sp. D39]
MVKPSEDEGPCGPGRYRSEEDLCAQWKAADSARDAADYAFWGLILAAIGTVGLLATLHYTRKAVLAAEEATKDADEALALAQSSADASRQAAEAMREANEIARAAQRARLIVSIYHIHQDHEPPYVDLRATNIGGSHCVVTLVASHWSDSNEWEQNGIMMGPPLSTFVAEGKAEVIGAPRHGPPKNFLYGMVRYADGLGEHRSFFAFHFWRDSGLAREWRWSLAYPKGKPKDT